MKLTYDISDRPKTRNLICLALQEMLAILVATTAVPLVVGHGLSPAAAMFGAGAGTLYYVFITRRRSPMFLGSSFTFVGPMTAAFAGGVSASLGLLGLVIGGVAAGFVYFLLSFIIRKVGVGWVDRLMPPVVIGPTIAIIGLSLAGNAVSNLRNGDPANNNLVPVLCGLLTLFVTVACSVHGKHALKLIPFLIGILTGCAAAAILTVIGHLTGIEALRITDFSIITNAILPGGQFSVRSLISIPPFIFLKTAEGIQELTPSYVMTVFAAFVPVAVVSFTEHIGDHKNLSNIIERDLLKDPGLDRTLMGDGVGTMIGAVLGGCPNTTYGEAIACVALTKNASTITTIFAALGCVLFSFFTPFVAFINAIPACVMGGICIALYGFIAVSGLKMIQQINLDENRNIFVVSVILISGIGGMTFNFGNLIVTEVAAALILGIITNTIVSLKSEKE